MKKIITTLGILLLLIFTLLLTLPLFLGGKVEQSIKNQVNQNLNATFNFEAATLGLLRHFPYATVSLKRSTLVNKAPFEGDTLFAAAEVTLHLSLTELFKGDGESIVIKSLTLDQAKLHLHIDEAENTNYDIVKKKEEQTTTTVKDTTTGSNIRLALASYAITNSHMSYEDESSGIRLTLTDLNHSGSGDLSSETSELETTTEALVSFAADSIHYLHQHKIAWDARIGIDLKQNRYTFLDNTALLNQLPLVFNGFVQVEDNQQQVDLTFSTPSSDFKNFFAAFPPAYAKNLENIQTIGNFAVNGQIKGIVDEVHIPTFHITLKAEDASFRYPGLPKSVQNITIDAEISNPTGFAEDTFVALNQLSFTLGGDTFRLSSRITDVLGNPNIKARVNGAINLANLSQAYPIPLATALKGNIQAHVTTVFDVETLIQKQYQNTTTQGTITLIDFEYPTAQLQHPIRIDSAAIRFTPQTVRLNILEGHLGTTDLKAKGTIDNLLGFLLGNEKIKGNFTVNAGTLALDDFRTKDQEEVPQNTTTAPVTAEEKIKIPAFLDITVKATADTVLYDNLVLNNLKGTLKIKDETATLHNLNAQLLGGTLALNGTVSTQAPISTFNLNLGTRRVNTKEAFATLGLFKAVAPVAKVLEGKVNTDITVSGTLKDNLLPNLATASGNMAAQFLSGRVNTDDAPLVSALDRELKFLSPEGWNLDDLNVALRFKEGVATVQPFTLNYKDIPIQVAGSHTFGQELNYTATLQVPAKYLSDTFTQILTKVDPKSLEEVTFPVTVNLRGSYTNPTVTTDLSSGVKQLATQLMERQKQNFITQGKAAAAAILSAITQNKPTESTAPNPAAPADTLSPKTDEDPIKKAAKSFLGELLGTIQKDTAQ